VGTIQGAAMTAAVRSLIMHRSAVVLATCRSAQTRHQPRDRRLTPHRRCRAGYTRGMKTAVSVPDDLFVQVDRLARRSHRSRSELYRAALREYLARHAPDEVTTGLDRVIAEVGQPDGERFAAAAARGTLGSTEW
jgi:predicted transcriptional regulator